MDSAAGGSSKRIWLPMEEHELLCLLNERVHDIDFTNPHTTKSHVLQITGLLTKSGMQKLTPDDVMEKIESWLEIFVDFLHGEIDVTGCTGDGETKHQNEDSVVEKCSTAPEEPSARVTGNLLNDMDDEDLVDWLTKDGEDWGM